MKALKDCFGYSIRLTDERLAHILEHPEMKGMGTEIERVLRQPQLVRRSRTDAAARLLESLADRAHRDLDSAAAQESRPAIPAPAAATSARGWALRSSLAAG